MPPIEDERESTPKDRGDVFIDEDETPEIVAEEEETPVVEDEPEEEVVAEAEPETPEVEETPVVEEEPTARGVTIPKQRFDEVNERRKAAEARVAELEAAEAARVAAATADPDEYDFEGKEKEYIEASLDGDTDKALAIRREIRAAEAAQYEARASAIAQATTGEDARQTAVRAAVDSVNARFPEVDPEAEEFSQDVADEAIAMTIAYQGAPYNLPFGKALDKAMGNVAKLHDLKDRNAAPAEEVPPAKPKADPKTVQEKIDAVNKQPPKSNGRAIIEPEFDIETATEAELAALPIETRRRLRGDIV